MEVSAGFLPLNIPTDSWIPFGIWVELEPPGVFPRWSWCRHQKSALEKLWRKVGKQLNGLCVTELWELTGRINWLQDKAWDPVCFRLYFAPLPFCSVLLLSFFLLCFVLFCFVLLGWGWYWPTNRAVWSGKDSEKVGDRPCYHVVYTDILSRPFWKPQKQQSLRGLTASSSYVLCLGMQLLQRFWKTEDLNFEWDHKCDLLDRVPPALSTLCQNCSVRFSSDLW